MLYKFINSNTIETAPKTLTETYEENGKQLKRLLLTPTEQDYIANGYYPLVEDKYPNDGYNYTPYYEKSGLAILKHWQQGEAIEVPTDATTEFMQTLSNPNTNSIAKIREAAKAFLNATEAVIDE